jgi:hypothetical protein
MLGQFPLTCEGAMLTCRTVATAHTVAAHAAALLQQIIITLCLCARRCDYTPPARARSVVMRRAASVTDGLTVVSAYLPNVSVGSPCSVLGTRTPHPRI